MDLRIIIHEGRGDVTIAVKSGPDGRRYSVKDDERNVDYRDLTETELEEKYRGFLCSLIHYAVADAAERHVSEIEMTVGHQLLSPAQSDDSPVVVCLERRNHTITIKAGPNGAVYSITDKAGRILHRDLSEPELRAKAPELYQFIRTAIGSNGGVNANDARVKIGLDR